jgi:carbon-monoxide dehydrogenase small subunit
VTPVSLTVNGRSVQALVEPRTHLADFLREHLHLTGTHLGCEQGVCGACTVSIDGKPQRSCIAYALDCDGSVITTIEGFDDDALMDELRTAFSAHHGLQCGFCTPGMLVTARDIVARLGDVPEARIRDELSGNLCRCTGYVGIVAAIRAVCAGRLPAAKPPAATHIIVSTPSTDPRATPEVISPAAAHPDVIPTAESPNSPAVMAGEGRPSTTFLRAASEVVDGQPEPVLGPLTRGPAMTGSEQRTSILSAAGITSTPGPQAMTQPAPPPSVAPGNARPTLTEIVTISAPPDIVWAALADLRAVASCLPGAEITAVDGTEVTGRLRVALGPISAAFAGQGTVTRDEAARSGSLNGRGRDTGTGSSVQGEAHYLVRPAGTATELEVTVSWRLTGALAQFARTEIVQALAQRLLGVFTANLEALIAGKPPAETRPLGLLGLLWAMIRARLFGR